MKKFSIPIRVVFYREEGHWIAHCLEFDLLGDGQDKEEALKELSEAITLQVQACIEHNSPDNLFSPAEGKYFQMFAAGKASAAVGKLELETEIVDIERLDVREYIDDSEAVTCV